MLKRHLNYNEKELNKLDLEDAFYFLKQYKKETDHKDIFNMQLQGIDPMKIPYYAEFIKKEESKIKKQKASLPPQEAENYKSVFDDILNQIGKSKNGKR